MAVRRSKETAIWQTEMRLQAERYLSLRRSRLRSVEIAIGYRPCRVRVGVVIISELIAVFEDVAQQQGRD